MAAMNVTGVVLCAKNLPKSDSMSKPDGYVDILVEGKSVLKTASVSDSFDPAWKAAVHFTAKATDKVQFVLYDKETFKSDKKLGHTEPITLQDLTHVTINNPLNVTIEDKWKDKITGPCTLTVHGFALRKSFASLKAELGNRAGVIVGKDKPIISIPIPQLLEGVYLSIEYDDSGVDVKLLATKPNIVLEIIYENVEFRKTEHHKPKKINGLACYAEVKLNDMSNHCDLKKTLLRCWEKDPSPAFHTTLDKVITKHGWVGSMSYADCRAKLHDVEFVEAEQEVIFPLEDHVKMIVDYDKGSVDMKLLVMVGANPESYLYDMSLDVDAMKHDGIDADDVNKKVTILGGKPFRGRHPGLIETELDDVPYGTFFKHMLYVRYPIHNCKACYLGEVAEL